MVEKAVSNKPAWGVGGGLIESRHIAAEASRRVQKTRKEADVVYGRSLVIRFLSGATLKQEGSYSFYE